MSLTRTFIVAASLALAPNAFSAELPALAKLQGKWSGTRTGGDGQTLTATIEIQGSKLIFQTFNADKEVRLFARGDVKAESVGGFSVLRITGVEAGRSATEIQRVDDDRSTIYVLRGDTLTLASNFDKERENETPRLETYERVAVAKESSPPADVGKLAGKWKMITKLGENELDHELSLVESGGKLSGSLISPRSGEHRFTSVIFSNGKLAMEVPRKIEGNDVTFVYTAELKGNELAGSVTAKGLEDQVAGTWTARK
jgi:hypothetical protein